MDIADLLGHQSTSLRILSFNRTAPSNYPSNNPDYARRVALEFDPIREARRNWERRGWGAPDAMVTATSITRAHQILLGRINAALAPFGLTFSRFEVLALLSFTQSGELPMGKIGDRLQVHPASVTNLVDRLVADGLVERSPHPADGRSRLVRLMPAGEDIVAQCAVVLAEINFGVGQLGPQAHQSIAAELDVVRYAAGDWTTPPS